MLDSVIAQCAGQVLWPAAHILSSFLARNPHLVVGRECACELGSGLGLVGLLAGRMCPVVLTDHNELVLRVLQRNVGLNAGDFGELHTLILLAMRCDLELCLHVACPYPCQPVFPSVLSTALRCMRLEWKSSSDVTAVLQASPSHGAGYDLLLGADICYSEVRMRVAPQRGAFCKTV